MPLLSKEGDGAKKMLYMDNYSHLLEILARGDGEDSFEYRQAKGVINAVKNYAEKINRNLSKLIKQKVEIGHSMDHFIMNVSANANQIIIELMFIS